jgi:hypothetical protein
MPIENTITEIVSRLRQGRFPNEQAISQGVVLRILQELGWDTWDTSVVWPEFQTGEGRADFALCHPPTKPAIFVEVKQPGKALDAVRQALEYAFHAGVPFVVLTDGQTWSFYLPAEQGSYEDRRVYKLDLYERPVDEAAQILHRYLGRDRVESGEALEFARKEYQSRSRKKRAQDALPEVWSDLLVKADEQLVEILSNAVETKIGFRPDAEDVAEFLKSRGAPVVSVPDVPEMDDDSGLDGLQEPVRPGELVLLGKRHRYTNAKEAMVIVLTELAKLKPSFLESCSRHPGFQGRKRHYIGRTPQELYPGRPDLQQHKESLPGGWFVATNLSNALKMAVIRAACDVAGLVYGKDLNVDF